MCVCMVCEAIIDAEFLCARSQCSIVSAIAWSNYSFSHATATHIARLRDQTTAFDIREQGLNHCATGAPLRKSQHLPFIIMQTVTFILGKRNMIGTHVSRP